MHSLLLANALIFSLIATGIVDWRILPLTGLRRINGRLDRASFGKPGMRRSWSRSRADHAGSQPVAGY